MLTSYTNVDSSDVLITEDSDGGPQGDTHIAVLGSVVQYVGTAVIRGTRVHGRGVAGGGVTDLGACAGGEARQGRGEWGIKRDKTKGRGHFISLLQSGVWESKLLLLWSPINIQRGNPSVNY